MGMTTNLKTTLRTCFPEHRGNIDLTEKKRQRLVLISSLLDVLKILMVQMQFFEDG